MHGEAARWWSRLGHGALVRVRPLTGGASDATVFEVNDGFILKVSGPTERARRELSFYRDLAPRVPVAVPRLVAGAEEHDGVGMLLSAAGTPMTAGRWELLATQLGSLHATVLPDWPHAKAEHRVTRSEAETAVKTWRHSGYAAPPAEVWPSFDRLDAALARLPPSLVHGDWHLGNLLLDPAGRIVWIDWQEAGHGRGPEDLALLWQRAEFVGAAPPREAMLGAYAAARGIPDDAVLRRATEAAELRLLLLTWPHFLGLGPEQARAPLLDRLAHLVETWSA